MNICGSCFSNLPDPTPHEAFSAKAQSCPVCKTVNAVGIEVREHMALGLFNRVEELEAKVEVMFAAMVDDIGAPPPHQSMPTAPGLTDLIYGKGAAPGLKARRGR
jgi:hypothetical protein